MEIVVEEHVVASKRVSKHSGVMVDDQLNFKELVEYAEGCQCSIDDHAERRGSLKQ